MADQAPRRADTAEPRRAAPSVAARCSGLFKRYGEVIAVDGLDLEVLGGETFGLLGPNGAGKTTTVEILEGLNEPDAGEVEVLHSRWRRGNDRALRERLGVALQETQLADKLTVEETIVLFRSFYRRGRTTQSVLDLLALHEKREARVEHLSGGQRQRLALACALVGQPDLLFLDEPTTGLDPQARLRIWEVIERFAAEGGTTILTTHYMEEAARLCDRVAIIDRGRVVALDTPSRLIASLGAEQIIEFEVSGSVRADDLERLQGVGRYTTRGRAHVLGATDIGRALPALLAALDRSGNKLERLTTHEPTLEDVFVSLTGRVLRDE